MLTTTCLQPPRRAAPLRGYTGSVGGSTGGSAGGRAKSGARPSNLTPASAAQSFSSTASASAFFAQQPPATFRQCRPHDGAHHASLTSGRSRCSKRPCDSARICTVAQRLAPIRTKRIPWRCKDQEGARCTGATLKPRFVYVCCIYGLCSRMCMPASQICTRRSFSPTSTEQPSAAAAAAAAARWLLS